MLSVVIPSRSPEYLQKTVDGLLDNAQGDIEVIVVLDGIWPEPILNDDPRVVVVHHGEVHNNIGMRGSISTGMALARGDYVMKIDEHCMVGKGYDQILAADCENDWIVIPRRKRLSPDSWEIQVDGRPDIDYMYVEYPYAKPLDKTQGLHGAEWKQRFYDRPELMIDDTPTMQGSCYYMKKSTYDKWWPDGLDDVNYGPFTQEAQELSMRAWLEGGRVIVNKNTFYAHYHKGKRGKGYGFSNEQYKKHAEWNERGRIYCINYWLSTKDFKHDFTWFVNEKFPDMPGWSDDWQTRLAEDSAKDYSTTKYKDDYWLSNLRADND